MHLFYDNLIIELNEVYAEIERLEIDTKEKKELAKIIDETSHHAVLDTILKHLDKSQHQTFLDHFHAAPHDQELMDFLHDKIDDLEDKITASIHELKQKFLADLKPPAK